MSARCCICANLIARCTSTITALCNDAITVKITVTHKYLKLPVHYDC